MGAVKGHYEGLNNYFVGEQFVPGETNSKHLLVTGDLVLDGAEKYIVERLEYAKLFLDLLKNGEIDVFEQLRLLKTIVKLHELCSSEYLVFKQLRKLFFEAMESLHGQAEQRIADYFDDENEFVSNLSDHFAFGEYHANSYVVYVAREHAVLGMVSKCAEQLSGAKPYKGDAYGESSIVLHGPPPKGIASTLVGEFKTAEGAAVARVYSRERGRFGLQFYDLDQFGNRLSLMIAAHEAAVPILQNGLEMTATVEWLLGS